MPLPTTKNTVQNAEHREPSPVFVEPSPVFVCLFFSTSPKLYVFISVHELTFRKIIVF